MSYPDPRYFGDPGEISAVFRSASVRPDLSTGAGGSVHYLATQDSTDNKFGLYRVTMGPDPGGTGTHFHRTMSESFYILSGKALALRRRALLAADEDAERYYADAIRLHSKTRPGFERARTELLYGEWLRRNRRRSAARHHLRSARDIFQRLNAKPWAERARRELRATGESQASENGFADDSLDHLTPQELQVVQRAAKGLSNREIGAQLFLSPRTVGHHLYKAYPKLGVSSRHELVHLFSKESVP